MAVIRIVDTTLRDGNQSLWACRMSVEDMAPVADDLRGVIAAKMIATDLERVGDLARNIAKCALRLADHPEVTIPARLRTLGDEVQRLLHRALDSFADGDAERAALVLEQDDQVDSDQDVVIRAAIQDIMSHPELTSQEQFRHFPTLMEAITYSTPRPRHPKWPEIENAFGIELSKAVAGTISPAA